MISKPCLLWLQCIYTTFSFTKKKKDCLLQNGFMIPHLKVWFVQLLALEMLSIPNLVIKIQTTAIGSFANLFMEKIDLS